MWRFTWSSSVGIESISMRSLLSRLVDQVDRLVGEESSGDVAIGKDRGGDQGRVLDADTVEDLVSL